MSKPINALAGRPQLSVAELTAAGVKRISLGGLLSRVALGGLVRALGEIKERGTFTFAKDAAATGELGKMMAGD